MKNKIVFHHVAIKFKEIDKAVKYFTKILDFKIVTEFTTKNGKKVINLKRDSFVIEAFETFSELSDKGKLKHLAFSTNNIEQAVDELKSKGIVFTEKITKSIDEDGKVFFFTYFIGPECLKLELHQEGERHD